MAFLVLEIFSRLLKNTKAVSKKVGKGVWVPGGVLKLLSALWRNLAYKIYSQDRVHTGALHTVSACLR